MDRAASQALLLMSVALLTMVAAQAHAQSSPRSGNSPPGDMTAPMLRDYDCDKDPIRENRREEISGMCQSSCEKLPIQSKVGRELAPNRKFFHEFLVLSNAKFINYPVNVSYRNAQDRR